MTKSRTKKATPFPAGLLEIGRLRVNPDIFDSLHRGGTAPILVVWLSGPERGIRRIEPPYLNLV